MSSDANGAAQAAANGDAPITRTKAREILDILNGLEADNTAKQEASLSSAMQSLLVHSAAGGKSAAASHGKRIPKSDADFLVQQFMLTPGKEVEAVWAGSLDATIERLLSV